MKGSMFWKTAIFICTHYLTILSDATLHNLIKVIAIALKCEIIWTGPVQRWSCQWVYGKARLLMTQGNKIQGELVFLWGDLPSYSLVKFQDDPHISRNTLLKLPSSGQPPSKTQVTLAASPFSLPCWCSLAPLVCLSTLCCFIDKSSQELERWPSS